ncbi:LOW QUALITY PROTEIN: ARF guanine-nucleotide exchange factor GNL2 [Actinidia eriantha]|uniref:LOW QUALITY PROTEIN: ARF guanine-nucleotide exchange factor GNL2 n=1 Tax=Actinidia eriantha TaxID=165200 RepID=UPI0025906EC5|nr:LOW QUALITY PROTEIN: ARF guanine-nucleotide exchange factor GNL2 [Actinidia eriantha]
MEETTDQNREEKNSKIKNMTKLKRKELGLSCMLNTEVGAVLAVIRRLSPEPNSHFLPPQEENYDTTILQSLKSLRGLIFNPQQEWRTMDPSMYLSPFLDVIQSDDMPAAATGVALSSILKILRLGIFDEKTPGAKGSINMAVTAITGCRLERTASVAEDAVMMRILQVLAAIVHHPAAVLLTDQAVCTVVNTCFQVVQQSAGRGDLLQRSARYTMHELIQTIFSRLPDIEVRDWENSESDTEDGSLDLGYGIRSAVDIFHFLCSLLNVVEVLENSEGFGAQNTTADEDVQLFALVLINSALELSGDSIGSHPKLLRMVQDDLCHHLIHYGTCSSPLVLSMICSTFLNVYHFLRRSIRLQLEAFFSFVLFKVMSLGNFIQLQELAIEGIINFCRQPTFTIEAYVNYDCDPTCQNVFEDVGKLLCKHAFPTSGALTSLQVQAFEGLVLIIHNIADNIDKEEDDSSISAPYPVEISAYRPFWEEKSKDGNDLDTWVEFVRVRKTQKRKLLIAGNHFNRDEKKGLEYLKISNLVSNPIDSKAVAMFFRHTPRLDKTMIGDYLGDPDDFHLQVLKDFTDTFEFSGMILDTALRTFLETFRLPGESQKIQRILEAFSEKFYDQQSSEVFANKDAVFILCYSLIMLNTDQHNPQVKKKMTEDEFIRNNRAINDGKDLPREYLSELFHSISTKAITIFGQSGLPVEMNPNRWIELMNRAKLVQPFVFCDFDHRLGRDMFSTIAGPSVATLLAIFEQNDDEEILHECIEGLLSVARIAQYGLEDTLDELLSSFCKFTTLLNPYASAEETLYAFSHDMKPRMATLAVFTISNSFGESIRGGWRNIVDCLLKLKRLKLLPQTEYHSATSFDPETHSQSESGVALPIPGPKLGHGRHVSGLIGRFSHFLSMESMEENLNLGVSEFEQNLKIIQQCQIGKIFSSSSKLPDEPLLNLGRSLIFAAAGKGQKFSTPVEEEETVGLCWDLVLTIALANTHRFTTFWPQYHDFLLGVAQFPLFSAVPFAEKAIVALMKLCLKLLSSHQIDKLPEELIFKSINLMWKLDKEIIDTSCEFIAQSVSKLLTKYPENLQTQLGWKSALHLLSITSRHPETYDVGVDTLIALMSDGTHVSRSNYAYCIDCAFGFIALKNTPSDKNMKIMDLLADSVNFLIQWYKNGYSDPGSSISMVSNTSSSSVEDNLKSLGSSNFTVNLFIKLGEALRKTSLARREEIRNHAISALKKSFTLAEELYFTPANCMNCFNLILFAMVDDLHEKMLEYSRRENAEREMKSMEGTLKIAMELLTEVYLQFLKLISEGSGFRTFWMGILRRMDTCMKAELGDYGSSKMQEIVPVLLKRMITTMKENDILVQQGGDELWETTYIQIQWIAPSLKEELFPDEL